MNRKWPVYDSHETASCFNCGGDFGPDGWWRTSSYPRGDGAYWQECSKCRMATFYDLSTDPKPVTGTKGKRRRA